MCLFNRLSSTVAGALRKVNMRYSKILGVVIWSLASYFSPIDALAETDDSEDMRMFKAVSGSPQWEEVFYDPGVADWEKNWFLDGEDSKVANTTNGMVLSASPDDHMVLWTRESFEGDIMISYNFTRFDEIHNKVCIGYIQATGKGEHPYTKDILEWAHLRKKAVMSSYYLNMNALHVSYAVDRHDSPEEYVRARQYPVPPAGRFRNTMVGETFTNTGLFKPGVAYRLTFLKIDGILYFRVQGDARDRLMKWDLSDLPPIEEGRFGLRQMAGRQSRYSDFRISLHRKNGQPLFTETLFFRRSVVFCPPSQPRLRR